MMFIQVRFNIILYMRAMNGIRRYFSRLGDIGPALKLPKQQTVPPYLEKGSYIQWAVLGMAAVNSLYLGAGLCTVNVIVGLAGGDTTVAVTYATNK